MPVKMAVIADDLTGANDTGVQFVKQGLQTMVLLSHDDQKQAEAEVIVIDTNTRSASVEDAYAKVAQVAAIIGGSQDTVIYKKIDSTLRGNLGTEIDAVMDACRQQIAIVAPAYPKNGRTIIAGCHLLHNIPLEATEIARDPKCPVRESYLPALLQAQTRRKVGHVGYKAILQGEDAVLAALTELATNGIEIISCDTWQDEQFNVIVKAAVGLSKPILWVGSAGFAECLPRELGLIRRPVDSLPILVVAGSVSGITRTQVTKLKLCGSITSIEINPHACLTNTSATPEFRQWIDAAISSLQAGNDVVLTSGYSEEVVERTKEQGLLLGLSVKETGNIVAVVLGEITKQVALQVKLGGIMLTGGDIAAAVCQALDASGIQVISEVATGVPLGVIVGGSQSGMPIVTKAGAFGSEDVLIKAVACLKLYKETDHDANCGNYDGGCYWGWPRDYR